MTLELANMVFGPGIGEVFMEGLDRGITTKGLGFCFAYLVLDISPYLDLLRIYMVWLAIGICQNQRRV